MEGPEVRAIWVVNEAGEMEDSVLRRFSYSLYFPRFSRQKRVQLWKRMRLKDKHEYGPNWVLAGHPCLSL